MSFPSLTFCVSVVSATPIEAISRAAMVVNSFFIKYEVFGKANNCFRTRFLRVLKFFLDDIIHFFEHNHLLGLVVVVGTEHYDTMPAEHKRVHILDAYAR